ncbi:hypothetical protein GCM10007063_01220 [Lentibacillus kapialis]|uniref:Uncharacterized protein n=1 Tax=Lentibacillus kapialis TaxID=340214 RepID=A0A917USN9_9BACI|nr:hypothetical protein [Lentibacillus kapialis]GGJ82455.1 hypothetical protein GCM10007063_01220 [Lentibacillus kapialis]
MEKLYNNLCEFDILEEPKSAAETLINLLKIKKAGPEMEISFFAVTMLQ